MDPLVKIMGFIDVAAAFLILTNFQSLPGQIIGWALVIKGAVSLLS